jgi:hypothetical protein
MDVLIDADLPSFRIHRPVGSPRPLAREPEAPDRGDSEQEAPEARVGPQAEAPDAGEGSPSTIDHDFKRGRSQS